MAAMVNAQLLILNHVSVKFTKQASLGDLIDAAQHGARKRNHPNHPKRLEKSNPAAIVLAHDFMEVAVPREGFGQPLIHNDGKGHSSRTQKK